MESKKYTSISNFGHYNSYCDFSGNSADVAHSFNDWCINHKPQWVHFFEADKGRMVATYTKDIGLRLFF